MLKTFLAVIVLLSAAIIWSPVQAEDAELSVIERVSPEYPRRAAMAGINGYVELSFTVTSDGRAGGIRVTNAQPNRIFDRAATQALAQWKFDASAAEKGGKVRIDFNI
jgi:protein TonB